MLWGLAYQLAPWGRIHWLRCFALPKRLFLGRRSAYRTRHRGSTPIKQAIEVVAGYGAFTAALLEQKTGQGHLQQPILIPVGMAAHKSAHRLIKILWELMHNAHEAGGAIRTLAHGETQH